MALCSTSNQLDSATVLSTCHLPALFDSSSSLCFLFFVRLLKSFLSARSGEVGFCHHGSFHMETEDGQGGMTGLREALCGVKVRELGAKEEVEILGVLKDFRLLGKT